MYGHRIIPAAVLAAGLCMTALAFSWVRDTEAQAQRAVFERLADRATEDIRRRLTAPIHGLSGVRATAAITPENVPTLSEIATHVAALDLPDTFPGVLGIGLIVPVSRDEIPAFESQVRQEGDAEFRVRSNASNPDLFVVKTIEPRHRGPRAIGYDVGAEPSYRLALERVIRESRTVATGPLPFPETEGAPRTMLLMTPIFASRKASREGASDAVIAVAYAAILYDELMAGTAMEWEDQVHLTLIDDGQSAPQTLFESAPAAMPPEALTRRQRIDYFGRDLEVVATSTPDFVAPRPLGDGWLVLILGLGMSLLASLLAAQQSRLRARAEALAQAMNRDLTRMAAVARLTKNAVVIADAGERAEWVNPAFNALTGYSDTEVIGRKPGHLLQSDATDRAEVARLAGLIRRGEPYAGILTNRSKQGRIYQVQMEIQPILSEGGAVEGFISVETDITERLAQEETLRANRALLEKTGAVGGVGGWRLDVANAVLTWTEVARQIHGVPATFVPDVANALAFFPNEARELLVAAIDRAIATGEPWDLELPFVRHDGEERWVRSAGEVERRNGTTLALYGAIVDITASVLERRRLAMESQRLEMILLGTNVGTWEWNVQTGEMRLNERWAEIVGRTLASLQPTSIKTWDELGHPDDLERSRVLLERHFAGDVPSYECEVRMRHADGRWVWILTRGRVLTRTDDHKPEWMFGIHLDITERKLEELRVAENEAMLNITLHSIGDAIVTADAEGRITWMNPVAELMSGWSTAEAKGRDAAEVLHLELEGQEGRAPCPVHACLQEGRKVGLAGNTTLVSRTGARYVIEDSAAPLRETTGPSRGVIVVFHDVTEKAKLANEMSYRASHDALTGLMNRAALESELANALERVRGSGESGALMFVDLDHFKAVNDACGHAAGDRLLVQITALLRAGVRSRDTVGRLGGDEFAILLEDCPMDHAEDIAKKIVESVDHYRYIGADGRRFRVGLSVGLVRLDGQWSSIAPLVHAADSACYAAKSQGRGRVVVIDRASDATSLAPSTILSAAMIEEALDAERLELHGQRILPLQHETLSVLRCEALVRIRDTEGKLHAPAAFMPTAERALLASRIDQWVLERVLKVIAQEKLPQGARISINLASASVGDRAFHQFALNALKSSGNTAQHLCVEITEPAVTSHLADANTFIVELRALGVQVAIDDFGTGTSSFAYLESLHVDLLKIDGHFAHGLLSGKLEAASLRSFVDVAGVLGLQTIAEQVECDASAERLTAMGVDYAQGALFHRPEPLADLMQSWRRESAEAPA